MSAFFVTLPSNTKEEGNLTGDYTCTMPDPIELLGDWQVGLAEITYTNSWDTLRKAAIWLSTFNYDNVHAGIDTIRPRVSYIRIPDGHYGTIQSLIDGIHAAIAKFWMDESEMLTGIVGDNAALREAHAPFIAKIKRSKKGSVTLTYDETIHRVNIKLRQSQVQQMYLSPNLMSMLGLKYAVEENLVTAEYPPNLLGDVSTLYVYVDIIAPQIVGNVKAPLIRNIAVTGDYGRVITVDFPNVHYVDLLNRSFQSITISIKSESGWTIPFNFGKTVVKLHFRRKRLQ